MGPGSRVAEASDAETSPMPGELETQVHYAAGPRGVSTPSSEPRTQGLQGFYRQTVVGNTSC